MDLYIIRHAWAGSFGDPKWPDDTLRPLSKKGQRRFEAMVDVLQERGVRPSLIAASPMVRCVQTAEILASVMADPPEIVCRDELLPNGNLDSLLQWSDEQSSEHRQIAWVGHSPDVCRITAALIGESEASIRFAKGAVAALRFDGPIELDAAELRWLATAKLLGC
ncbi:MAG: SixA phosphatase family protein [Thermoguttaceae bacterium]